MVKAIWQVLFLSAAVHATLILYSLWHDKNFQFKYTDVDYWIFSDAARAVSLGLSPFVRTTYRYTPLLAYLLVPGHWLKLEASFGKFLFSAVDLCVGFLIYRLLRLKGWHSVDAARSAAVAWLLNPMALAISTRGNAESIVCAVCLGVVYLLMVRKRVAAALLFGFAVHFKLFPVIFAPSILFFLGLYHRRSSTTEKSKKEPEQSPETQSFSLSQGMGVKLSNSPLLRSASPNKLTETLSAAAMQKGKSFVSRVSLQAKTGESLSASTPLRTTTTACGTRVTIYPPSPVLLSLWNGQITVKSSHLWFSLISFATFALLTGVFYAIYGQTYWQEAIWYHLTRRDHRHNFSPYFLAFYFEPLFPLPKYAAVAAFVPQVVLTLLVAFKYARKDLPFACFLQTFLFVTFNKVCTSQVWKELGKKHELFKFSVVLFVVSVLLADNHG